MAGQGLIGQVCDLLREVAAEVVMPRFRKLAEAEVRVKSPGEEVTIADEEAERLLNLRLPALLPGSRVIGEEAVSARPELLRGLGEGTVFVVDPVAKYAKPDEAEKAETTKESGCCGYPNDDDGH